MQVNLELDELKELYSIISKINGKIVLSNKIENIIKTEECRLRKIKDDMIILDRYMKDFQDTHNLLLKEIEKFLKSNYQLDAQYTILDKLHFYLDYINKNYYIRLNNDCLNVEIIQEMETLENKNFSGIKDFVEYIDGVLR